MKEDLVVVESISDNLDAEILRSLLESFGIDVLLSREAAASALGLSVGPISMIDLLVPQSQAEEAKKIIHDYQQGKLDVND